MIMMIISEYEQGTRTATVYSRGSGYRIVLLDSYFETQNEKYADTLSDAENIAEDWIYQC